jgi:hypothetical protein
MTIPTRSVTSALFGALLVVSMVLSACGGDDAEALSGDGETVTDADAQGGDSEPDAGGDGADPDGDASETADQDADSGDLGDSDTDGDDTGGDDADSGDSADGTGDDGDTPAELPGDEWEGFADAGDELAVIGVAYDDVLNVRSIPGNDGEIIATLDPDGYAVATGQARLLPSSAWYEVTTPGDAVTGWAALSFLAYPGGTDDATSEFLDGGLLPRADTLTGLAELVAAGFASEDPPSSIVQITPGNEGDASSLADVTYDVVGLGDDAASGYRLHIFATNDGDGFSLKSIERTVLCTRGLSGELCT